MLKANCTWFLLLCLLCSCARVLDECGGPPLDVETALALRETVAAPIGPKTFLVLPNPIDATSLPMVMVNDPAVTRSGSLLRLSELLTPTRLDNSWLKIRIGKVDEDVTQLAKPNASGDFKFDVSDIHYSESLAYYALNTASSYLKSLGFSLSSSRSLFVLVRATDTNADQTEVNAFYEHGYFDKSKPRLIRFIGDTQFSPNKDLDLFRHEFGHGVLELLTAERGIDFAGDSGASFTEGAAIHECLADYLAESMGDKDYIGKWIARNFSSIQPGEPLRSAVDNGGDSLSYDDVTLNDGTGENPERYRVAEWCTRVLHSVRKQFVSENEGRGPVIADRLIFSAASRLSRDASIAQFQKSISDLDKEYHCGLHRRSIKSAFESRGFSEASSLPQPLSIAAEAYPIDANKSPYLGADAGPREISFAIRVINPNGAIARNVRIRLESKDPKFHPTTYLQGLGSLAPSQVVTISAGDSRSLFGEGESATGPINYQIKVEADNAPTGNWDGVIR